MHGFACVLLHTTNYNHTHPTPTTHKKIMTTPLLINNAAALLLPPQTLNTYQKTSHRSHTTTKSTTTPLPTNHYPLNTPQNLSSPTTQTNNHQHSQINHLPAHPTSAPLHQPHQTHNTAHALSDLQHNQPTRSYQHIITPQLTSQKISPPNNKTYCRHLTNQSSPNTS